MQPLTFRSKKPLLLFSKRSNIFVSVKYYYIYIYIQKCHIQRTILSFWRKLQNFSNTFFFGFWYQDCFIKYIFDKQKKNLLTGYRLQFFVVILIINDSKICRYMYLIKIYNIGRLKLTIRKLKEKKKQTNKTSALIYRYLVGSCIPIKLLASALKY